MLRALKGGVAEKGADRRQAQITTAAAELAMLLQMLKKGPNQRGVDLLEHQLRGRLMQPLLGELEQLAESVAIGADRVRTHLALLHQALGEKTLQQRRKAGCGHS
ncbi:MAG: hypothetical protein WBG92_01165 [Thiohalocapsa sp.]